MRSVPWCSRGTRIALLAVGLAVLLVWALAPVLTGCDSGPGNDSTPDTTARTETSEEDKLVLAMSDVSRLAPAAPQADVLSAAAGIRAFGIDLYEIIAQSAGDGNLVFSPASIVTALAMTHAGAAGTTAQEMAAVLHFALEGDELHQAFNSLDLTLESRSWQQKNYEGKEEGVLVKTANSLWGQRDTAFEPSFLDTLAANYGAGIRLVDYKTKTEEARKAINEWVAGETNDKIRELIPEGALGTLTRLVLVNAIYLDATWSKQFDPDLTRDKQFTNLAGDVVSTPMMVQEDHFPYAKGNGWQAIELPYLGGQLAMLVIVPDEGTFRDVEGGLSSDPTAGGLIDETVSALDGTEVKLTMPKFEFRTQAGLSAALAALGMPSAFDPAVADFSRMTVEEDFFISDVIHEAYIAVDEEGTEAAAATAVVMEAAAIEPQEVVQLTIDRPFLFALRDRETGAILFLGRVTDPTA